MNLLRIMLALLLATTLSTAHAAPKLVGDGKTDNQQALQAALNAAAKARTPLTLPAGTFLHTGVLVVSGTTLQGQGASTVLRGIMPNKNAVKLTGSGSVLTNLKLTYNANKRVMTDESSLVLVQSASDFKVTNLHLDGSDSTAIMVNNSASGTITGNSISNTLADSIHITNKSQNIVVENNTTYRSGDDGIAVVSYERNGGTVKNITIRNNRILDNVHARGISVVGGENVLITKNAIRCKADYAGIYIASESSYKTFGVNNIIITENTTDHCGSSRIGHDSIMLHTDNEDNNEVLIENNTVNNTRRDKGIWVFALNGARNTNVTVRNNRITFENGRAPR